MKKQGEPPEAADLSGYRRKGTTVIGYRAPRGDRPAGGGWKFFRRIWEGGMEQNAKQDSTWNTRPIRNRDIPKLTRVLYAMQDVSATERRRLWLQERLWNMTAKLTGMPGGGGDPKGYEENFAEICEMEEKYAEECARFMGELKEAEEILNGIEPENLRTFAAMKYVMGMSRSVILRELNLKRWEYSGISSAMEQAESMKDVKWPERYALKGEK